MIIRATLSKHLYDKFKEKDSHTPTIQEGNWTRKTNWDQLNAILFKMPTSWANHIIAFRERSFDS